MKKISLLTLALLAGLATSASAATDRSESDLVVLPTYVVSANPATAAEQQVQAGLRALRELAARPVAVALELTGLKSPLVSAAALTAVRLVKS
jgi:hypothetical protein